MRAGRGIVATPWWNTPVETRWWLLNWPGWTRLAVLACYLTGINWLFFAPAAAFKDVPELFVHQDKIAHGSIFLALALLVRWSVPANAARDGNDGWPRYGVPAALMLYACSSEVLQPIIGGLGRHFDWLDMASNFAGLFSGWLLFGAAIDKSQAPLARV